MGELDKRAIYAELESSKRRFHALLETMSGDDMRQPSNGTRWTNEELLFHMLFGYLVVLVLLVLAKVMAVLPKALSRRFARALDAATVPFHWINYLGSRVGARVFNRRRMGAKFDRVVGSLARRLAKESDRALARGMYFPARWDPFFKDYMTLGDIYHYPTLHFDFHARQLTNTHGR